MKPFDKVQTVHFVMCWIIIMMIWVTSSLSNHHIIPTMSNTFEGLIDLWNNGLFTHIFSSIGLFLMALPIAVMISLLFSYMTLVPATKPLAIFVSKLRFLPLTGITFYVSFIVNSARQVQIWILVIFMSTYLVTSLVAVFNSISNEEINHAKTLGLSRWEIFWQLIVVGRVDYVIESIRQNFSIIWLMLVTVESILATSGGIGFLIKNSDKFMNLGKVLALQIIILIIGILLDYGLTKTRKILFRYSLY